jgi:hypothetical protein
MMWMNIVLKHVIRVAQECAVAMSMFDVSIVASSVEEKRSNREMKVYSTVND